MKKLGNYLIEIHSVPVCKLGYLCNIFTVYSLKRELLGQFTLEFSPNTGEIKKIYSIGAREVNFALALCRREIKRYCKQIKAANRSDEIN